MSLSYYKLAVILDKDAGGQNGAVNQALQIFKSDGVTLASIFSDEAGINPIAQPGAVTDELGNFEFWSAPGNYVAKSGDFEIKITVGVDDDFPLIESFGAVGDGVTDDSVAIQDCLDYANTQGFTAIKTYLPHINFSSNINFRGLGLIGGGAKYNPNGAVVTNLEFTQGLKASDGFTERDLNKPMSSEASAIEPGDWKIVFENGGRVYCVTKGGSTKRGLITELLTGNYVAPALPSDSLNTNWELWRIVSVQSLDECIVYKRETSETGTWADFNPTLTALGITGSSVLFNAVGRESFTIGNTITYNAKADRKGKMTVAFQMSSASDTACEIRVDGVLYDTIDLTNPDPLLYNYEITTTPGDHTVQVTHGANTVLRVLGVNLKSIDDINSYENDDYDAVAAYISSPSYIPRYQVCDYAFRDTIDDLWGGSYHGGETALVPAEWCLDGELIDPTVSGYIGVGRAFSVFQRTRITWSTQTLDINNSTRFGDSCWQQSIACVGEVQAKTFHNGMLGSSFAFDSLVGAGYIDDMALPANVDLPQLAGNSLTVQQVDRDTGKKIIAEFTPIVEYNDPDYNSMTLTNVSNSYYKLYRGFVRNTSQKIVNPSWTYAVTFA